jgi:nucleotide-binding universal stress UspA family protein
MYPLILVPLDGSPTAQRGLTEALALARALGSTLRIVHVVDAHQLPAEISAAATVGQLLEGWRADGQRIVHQAGETARMAGVEAQEGVLFDPAGRVCDLIIDDARRAGAGLIVMGTHGRRGWRRLALGSDAELVLRESPVPVLLVRAAEAETLAGQAG